MTTPHPLLGVPVVFRHGDEEIVGYIEDADDSTVLLCSFRQSASGGQKLIRLSLSSEGTYWRRAGVEYLEPKPAPATEAKSLGQVLYEADHGTDWKSQSEAYRERYDRAASAVIAAYEAGRPKVQYETVTRWAVRVGQRWFTSQYCDGARQRRTLFATQVDAREVAHVFNGSVVVPVPYRRRVKVKP